jgi:3-oxoacyl-[acyl-carrier-protein] synthase-1
MEGIKRHKMNIIGTNIISSLGFTTQENFENVKRGISGVRRYDSRIFELPEGFMASLINKEQLDEEFEKISTKNNFTNLEKAAILSVFHANREAKIDMSSEKVIFILSTTKGNIHLLDKKNRHDSPSNTQIYLWHSAKQIAKFFGNQNTPFVVSNACISGATAQIAALRALQSKRYDYAVVVGADFLSKFIISGFQSFKALSSERCKPFGKDRCGLNLGEAAATIIFQTQDISHKTKEYVSLVAGATKNDADHISAPSRTGEGSYRALKSILCCPVSFVNAHGTATPYNDAMETQAITRAELTDVPVNSLKAYFGHTLGAAGVLESIISMRALQEGIVLPIEPKTSNQEPKHLKTAFSLNIPIEIQKIDKKYFVKMLSGFGGVNAALLFENGYGYIEQNSKITEIENPLYIKKHIRLSFKNYAEISEYYRSLQIDYPKFFRMDNLSKLGFLAAEKIFENTENRFVPREDIAIICLNRSASLEIDTQYQETIRDDDNYFPSPSLFVYTLPNICAGEIAIRNKFFGETAFYVTENFDAKQIFEIVQDAFFDKMTNNVLLVWVESIEGKHEILMCFIDKNPESKMNFTTENILNLKNEEEMEKLILKLKEEIIEVLNLEDVKPADIDENAPLFGDGLGLDSIDALELIVLMEKNYGIKLQDPNKGKEIFKSIAVMADYIQTNRTK